MPDYKITELDENTTPALGDLIPMIDDPAGTPVTQKVSINTLATILGGNSLSRQALINGNFDVWQRGTTSTGIANNGYVADRWKVDYAVDGGTFPTHINRRLTLTGGDLYGAGFGYEVNVNGAGTSLGNNSYYQLSQTIENGTRYLCGNGKKVTLSFWAKSDIANKKIGAFLVQNYGSTGSPSSDEIINGGNFTLTSSWVKYTFTFTTNTLSGKTFGTDNNDYLRLIIPLQWGSNRGVYIGDTGVAQTFVGSGNIDIAQVQLCARDVALPFQPKSYEQELHDCLRYYEKIGPETSSNYARFSLGWCETAGQAQTQYHFTVPKRNNAFTLETTGTASHYALYYLNAANGLAVTALTSVPSLFPQAEQTKFIAGILAVISSNPLVLGRGCSLLGNNNSSAWLAFNNEL